MKSSLNVQFWLLDPFTKNSKVYKLIAWCLTLSQTSPGFYMSAVQVLKTLWEKEKLLIKSNFSFSHCVFYLFEELSAILINLEIVVCKLFQFGRV